MTSAGETEDLAWQRGYRAAGVRMLNELLGALGYDAPKFAQLAAEREAAIVALRRACADHGDNGWPDNLHLADIIEKHLMRHLEDDGR